VPHIGRIDVGADRGRETGLGQLELGLVVEGAARLRVGDERTDARSAAQARTVRQRHRKAGHAVGEIMAEIDESHHAATFPSLPSPRRFLTAAEYPISAERQGRRYAPDSSVAGK
jgi:hypothetical protein